MDGGGEQEVGAGERLQTVSCNALWTEARRTSSGDSIRGLGVVVPEREGRRSCQNSHSI